MKPVLIPWARLILGRLMTMVVSVVWPEVRSKVTGGESYCQQ